MIELQPITLTGFIVISTMILYVTLGQIERSQIRRETSRREVAQKEETANREDEARQDKKQQQDRDERRDHEAKSDRQQTQELIKQFNGAVSSVKLAVDGLQIITMTSRDTMTSMNDGLGKLKDTLADVKLTIVQEGSKNA